MAIMQERYVRITSSNMGNSAIQERDLNGLVFTQGRGWLGGAAGKSEAFGTGSILKCYSVDQVRKYFASTSAEVAFATKYFSYISPSGSSPASLSFARLGVYQKGDATKALLSWEYGMTSADPATYGYGWFTSATAATAELSFSGTPADASSVLVQVGGVEAGTYTFVSSVRTSKNQVLIGENAAETAADFAAVVNGESGFYGQKANDHVVATVAGDVVTLTSRKTGSSYSIVVSSSGTTNVTSSSTAGTQGGVYVEDTDVDYETPAAALSRVNQLSGNFGSFALLTVDGASNSDIKALLTQNAGYNYKYLASVGIVPAGAEDTTNEIAFVTTVQAQNGATAARGDGTTAAIPMAIFGAIDYDGTNTAPNFMFKQISGEVPTVTGDDVADILDGIHVNYYGLTQVNGQQLAFYQRGFNLDGEDTAVYCNEVWLKSHIATAIFNLLVSVERVPANEDGEAMIYTAIAGAAADAVRNGTIEPGKTYTAAQQAKIYQLTGDSEAYLAMQNAGYWLNVVIEQDGNEYKAVYKLVYGKGDSIRFVEGHDILM